MVQKARGFGMSVLVLEKEISKGDSYNRRSHMGTGRSGKGSFTLKKFDS
jgi:hypothetical protein